MRTNKSHWGVPLIAVLVGLLGMPMVSAESSSRLDEVLDAVIANEADLARQLAPYKPLVETYLQTVRPDAELGTVPVRDHYFFGRLELPVDVSEPANGKKKAKKSKKNKEKTLTLFNDFHSATFKPESFARMLIVDRGQFNRQNYKFEFVRSEFLGEVRTLVFDVFPMASKPLNTPRAGGFNGRIWVEDKGFHIVRFNGIYMSAMTVPFHFDSWRMNMAPGAWYPAFVYTEEPEPALRQIKLTHKGQTRIWGYDVQNRSIEDEFTQVLIEAPQTVDANDRPGQISPIEAARAWESEAEDNVLRRLQRAGLLAPAGEVDQVLETVVANLEITNDLNIHPPIRARVLVTTPLESFTVGHTIVLSRGLIDVLPDEASLAMVLAHEMGHILSGHELDTRFAFTDQIMAGDRQAMDQFLFERDPAEELEADNRAVDLLKNSPYADGLDGAGLFLKALASKTQDLPSLISPHFGARFAKRDAVHRMTQIVDGAPELDPTSLEQIAALPLGGRVRLDPWTAQVELMKNPRVPLLSAREKMPFQVTPLMPYLARFDARGAGAGETVAAADRSSK